MDLENTENHGALSAQTLQELMQDIRTRTQARREAAARVKREREEADRKEREETGRVARHSSEDDDDYYDDFDKKRGMRRDASFSAGSALRETDEQIFRVFQLFDPKNTKLVPEHEIILFLRAVAIDVDDTILADIIATQFSQQEQFQIRRDGGVTFSQILKIIRKAGTESSAKQEARRVFDTVFPSSSSSSSTEEQQQQQQSNSRTSTTSGAEKVLKYEDFRKALSTAEARITDGELSEIYRYCSVSGNRGGLTLKDWEDVAEFVLENAD